MSDPSFHLKKCETEEQIKPKIRRKEKIRADINDRKIEKNQ